MDGPAVFRWEEVALERVTAMVARKVVQTASLEVRQVYLKRGAVMARHTAVVEQVVYVLQGALQAQVDGVSRLVREGEMLAVPAGATHQVEAVDDTFVLSVHASDVVGPGT